MILFNGNFEYPSSSFNRKYYDQIISADYEYSQSMCFSFGQFDWIDRNNCSFGFSSINSPNNNIDNMCSISDFFLSNFQVNPQSFILYWNYFENENVDNKCEKLCPLECKIDQNEL